MQTTPLPTIPSGPLIERLVFQSAVLGPVLGGTLAVCAFVVLRRSEKRLLVITVVLVCLAAGAGLGIASRAVETQRELGVRLTDTFISQALTGNRSALDPLVAASVSISATGERVSNTSKEWLLNSIQMIPDWLQSGSHSIEDSGVDNETTTRTLARVRIEPNWTLGPSLWMFTWRLESDGQWRLYGIEALRFGLRDADAGSLRRGRP